MGYLKTSIMSWFADLAGKAEDLLNRVDQGAASALSKKDGTGNVIYDNTDLESVGEYPELHQQTGELKYQTSSKATYISSAADNIKHQKATILAGTANVKAASKMSSEASSPAESVSTPRPSSQFVRRKKSEPNDELLFDFLNSSEKGTNGRMDPKKEKSKTVVLQNHSLTSSISSMPTSTQNVKTTEDNSIRSQSHETPDGSDSGLDTQVDVTKDSSLNTATNHSLSANDDCKSHELSNLRLENQLLRNENEFAARLSKMEVERQNLAEAVTAAERKYVDEKRKVEELQQQVKVTKNSLESVKQELVDYKQKATRILQDMEAQQVSEAESAKEQLQDLQEQIATHKMAKQEVEAELERQKQELHYNEEELYRTKNTLQSRIKDREEEIQKLRNQLTNKALSSSSQSELENRLHQLTETLIQKQTMLESLSTEKNSLVYQLERLEQQLKTIQGSSTNGPTINMAGIDSGEGTRMRSVPVLFSDVDANMAGMYGRVRKAASSIDQFSPYESPNSKDITVSSCDHLYMPFPQSSNQWDECFVPNRPDLLFKGGTNLVDVLGKTVAYKGFIIQTGDLCGYPNKEKAMKFGPRPPVTQPIQLIRYRSKHYSQSKDLGPNSVRSGPSLTLIGLGPYMEVFDSGECTVNAERRDRRAAGSKGKPNCEGDDDDC
ncbi:Golgin subfamily A member 5 [Chelonia mydas]|uniref:Golgin subfamily A member 5 n=1 Tax=Chelonia mydas TaxID=8469 RepID=M7CG52_CHEMY|nr:Golgin subfamily A member 5 [Chelonia mydas]